MPIWEFFTLDPPKDTKHWKPNFFFFLLFLKASQYAGPGRFWRNIWRVYALNIYKHKKIQINTEVVLGHLLEPFLWTHKLKMVKKC